jgi:hypothetical protein
VRFEKLHNKRVDRAGRAGQTQYFLQRKKSLMFWPNRPELEPFHQFHFKVNLRSNSTEWLLKGVFCKKYFSKFIFLSGSVQRWFECEDFFNV